MIIDTSDFRKGLKIEFDNEVYEIVDFQHARTAQRRAFVRTRLKNIATGNVRENTFSAGEKVNTPNFEERSMQYLYKEGSEYIFMDTNTYEQIHLDGEKLENVKYFFHENMEITVQFYKSNPIGINLPFTVEAIISETEPGFKGDTVSGGGKPAKTETGYQLKVPFFINVGDKIKIDTRTGEYLERVK